MDVFTAELFGGNPLAIVENADGLTTLQMQTIAREFNLSETIFIQTPDDPAHSAKVRIFFPTDEIPFAGHPTIGCAIHLAMKQFAGKNDFETAITLEEVAGLVPVSVRQVGGAISAQFTAPVVPRPHKGNAPSAELAAAALGLDKADIGFGGHSPGVHIGGPAFLYIPVASLDVLGHAGPREPGWSEMLAMANVDSAYLYTPGNDATDYQARMFSPTAGIPEDPATGSATAILAAQLLGCGALGEGTSRLSLLQGVEMGRRSELGLEIDVVGKAISAVRVSGSAVAIGSGTIRIPAE